MENDSDVMIEEEVAGKLRISPETLRKWRAQGVGPPTLNLPGRVVRYSWQAVQMWLDAKP